MEDIFDGLEIFDAVVMDDKFEHGTNTISLVDSPATKQGFFMFSEQGVKNAKMESHDLKFAKVDSNRGLIEGVLMLAETPILRVVDDKKFGIKFSAEVIEKMAFKFMRNLYGRNINEDHDPSKKLHDVYLVESYIYDPSRGRVLPEHMDANIVKPGSWIVTLKSEDADVNARIANGELFGFSLEGNFGLEANFSEDLAGFKKSLILDPNISIEDKVRHIKKVTGNV